MHCGRYFLTQFLCQALCTHYPENPEENPSDRRLNEHGIYISDTARNRSHSLFRSKREPIPLGHSEGQATVTDRYAIGGTAL